MGQSEELDGLRDSITTHLDALEGNDGLKTIAALMLAARYARRTDMPIMLAASMLADLITGVTPRG
jgi:hypothetical protein